MAKSSNDEGPRQIPAETQVFLARIPSVAWRGLAYAIVILLGSAIGWTYYSRVDLIVSGEGILISDKEGQRVESPANGEIIRMFVEEGQSVQRGMLLFKLRSPQLLRELSSRQKAMAALQDAKHERDKALPSRVTLTGEKIRSLGSQKSELALQNDSTKQKMVKEKTRLAIAQKEHRHQLKALAGQITNQKTEISIAQVTARHAKGEYDRKKDMYKSGQLPANEWMKLKGNLELADLGLRKQRDKMPNLEIQRDAAKIALEREAFEYQLRLLDYTKSLHQNKALMASLEARVADLRLGILKDRQAVAARLKKAQAAYDYAASVVQPGVKIEDDLVVVRSPTSGTVTRLTFKHTGKVVAAGDLLAEIAPKDAPLVARVLIPNNKIAHLKPGQEAKIKYRAYPFEQYGIYRGKVEKISPDVVRTQPVALGLPVGPPSYHVMVSLIDRHVLVDGTKQPLRLGLTADIEIITRRRRLITVMLKPFERLLKGGLTVDR